MSDVVGIGYFSKEDIVYIVDNIKKGLSKNGEMDITPLVTSVTQHVSLKEIESIGKTNIMLDIISKISNYIKLDISFVVVWCVILQPF